MMVRILGSAGRPVRSLGWMVRRGALSWGDGGSLGILTHLGRVLRCFEWFRDLVDPWWIRNRMSTSLWMHRF